MAIGALVYSAPDMPNRTVALDNIEILKPTTVGTCCI